MVNVALVAGIVSIGFLVAIVAVMSYLAFAGPTPDRDSVAEDGSSTAD
jgi:hypothetical protein